MVTNRIDASVRTATVFAQLATHVAPASGTIRLREAVHTIALQRQARESFSVGRFDLAGGLRDYVDLGRVMFVPAGIPLEIETDGGETRSFRCIFDPASFERLLGKDWDRLHGRLHNCLNIKSPAIRNMLIRMANEVETPGLSSVELLDAYGKALLIELARYLEDSIAFDAVKKGGLSRGAYRRIIARIETETASPSLAEMAQIAQLSERQLSRAFKQSTGLTIQEHIAETRFRRASSLLSEPEPAIGEIATAVGYASPAAFATAFRRWSGESPRKFRRRARLGAAHQG